MDIPAINAGLIIILGNHPMAGRPIFGLMIC